VRKSPKDQQTKPADKYRLTVEMTREEGERYEAFIERIGAKKGTYARRRLLDDVAAGGVA